MTPPEKPSRQDRDEQEAGRLPPDDSELDLLLGPRRQATMNGPQYTQRDKARAPWEDDIPAPHEDA